MAAKQLARASLVVALAACGSSSPKPVTPAPVATVTAQPAAAAATPGMYCWISEPRKSGCTADAEQCRKDAEEMRGRPDTKITSECARQAPVHCYTFADEQTPLCYASPTDCDDGRARMAEYGETSECKERR
jgi:hypothetical protein